MRKPIPSIVWSILYPCLVRLHYNPHGDYQINVVVAAPSLARTSSRRATLSPQRVFIRHVRAPNAPTLSAKSKNRNFYTCPSCYY
jgi:hypothetical protein